MTVDEQIENRGCAKCINSITLYKHPWNEKFKGSVREEAGLYACIVEHDMSKNRKGIIMERDGVGCELFLDINHKELEVLKKYDM